MSPLGWMAVALAVGGVSAPGVVLWLRHRALGQQVTAARRPTQAELDVLRRRGRSSVAAFVLFWTISLTLVLVTSRWHAPSSVEMAVFVAILLMAAGGIAFQLRTRCPICQYRLGYQRTLGVPFRCERCGASFSR